MSEADRILDEALRLPEAERGDLALRLILEALGPDEAEEGYDEAWSAELAERLRRFEAGESVPMPAEEVLQRLRRPPSGRTGR